jgi:adenine-specific DNA-methyltransferase
LTSIRNACPLSSPGARSAAQRVYNNEESFFVRHAYFTGADEPYNKLKRALRAEVDEATWSSLYSTTSRLFPTPESKKIAIKFINHYGDEVLKVYSL